LEIDAKMQGSLSFKDPVNLMINGDFEGTLDAVGRLTIGERATVKAKIKGETVILKGEMIGDIEVTQSLELSSTARLIGDVNTPLLAVEKGAVLQGQLNMIAASEGSSDRTRSSFFDSDELASYLSVEKSLVKEWAEGGKLPGVRDGERWRFDKKKVDEWVASGRIK